MLVRKARNVREFRSVRQRVLAVALCLRGKWRACPSVPRSVRAAVGSAAHRTRVSVRKRRSSPPRRRRCRTTRGCRRWT